MANYGPNDTQLVVVIGANLRDATDHIRHFGPSSEVHYLARSLLEERRLEGLRWNRLILTPWAQDELERAKRIVNAAYTLKAASLRLPPDARIEWPDGV